MSWNAIGASSPMARRVGVEKKVEINKEEKQVEKKDEKQVEKREEKPVERKEKKQVEKREEEKAPEASLDELSDAFGSIVSTMTVKEEEEATKELLQLWDEVVRKKSYFGLFSSFLFVVY
jgi:hypothetical protein